MRERGVGDFSAEVNRQHKPITPITSPPQFFFAKAIHVKAHEQRQGDREPYRESSPGRFSQSIDYDQPESSEGDDHDEENRDGRDYAGQGADFGAGQFGERFSFAGMLAPRIMKSCTAPPRQTPITSTTVLAGNRLPREHRPD